MKVMRLVVAVLLFANLGWMAVFFGFLDQPFSGSEGDASHDAICKTLSDEMIAELSEGEYPMDFRLYRVEAFYSKKLDSCIHVEEWLFGPKVRVVDLTRSVIIDDFRKYPPLLLYCDIDGVNEADIPAVRERKGRVFSAPYREWLTDGLGGLPSTLKTPAMPFTRDQCGAVLKRWLEHWR